MREKMFFRMVLVAGAATMLAACTSESENGPSANISYESIAATQQVPVTFGTYIGETPVTRAGYVGNMNTGQLQTNNFGVFAYHTPEVGGKYLYWNTATSGTDATKLAADYDAAIAANFMFNQKVTYSGGTWSYEPMKYWPNDISSGTVDNGNSYGSATKGNVSFFAYAPYVDFSNTAVYGLNGDSPTASANYGITAINGETSLATANAKPQDPILTYKVNYQYPVDLLWGTAGASDENVNGTAQNGGYTTPSVGVVSKWPVNVNMNKQKVDGKVDFDFKHALAGLGGGSDVSSTIGFQAVLDIDNGTAITGGTRETFDTTGGTTPNAWRTIISIKDIVITNDLDGSGVIDGTETGFYETGTFNLATGVWTPSGTAGVVSQKIGTSGIAGVDAILNTKLAEYYDSTPTTWKEHLGGTTLSNYFAYTNTEDEDSTHPGVMEEDHRINVYESSAQTPLLFIPDGATVPKFKVVVDYVVRTYDSNLSRECTEVEQKISKTIIFPAVFGINQHYNLIMHLGLTGVKFTASVDNWDEGTGQSVDLPINVAPAP